MQRIRTKVPRRIPVEKEIIEVEEEIIPAETIVSTQTSDPKSCTKRNKFVKPIVFTTLGLASVAGAAAAGYFLGQRAQSKVDGKPLRAVAVLRGESGAFAIVRFTQLSPERVLVEGEAKGLAKGLHGFHVHEKGDTTQGCQSAGPHFNPTNKNHGGPSDKERHIGDLGNIEVVEPDTTTRFRFTDHMIKLYGPHSVVGRSLVIHTDEDDLGKGSFPDSLTTGHSGARACCGVIGWAQ